MEKVNLNRYTAAQLRDWLQNLNLPTSGTKSAVVLRLNAIPPNDRGECPTESVAAANTVEETNDSIGCMKKQRSEQSLMDENEIQTSEQNQMSENEAQTSGQNRMIENKQMSVENERTQAESVQKIVEVVSSTNWSDLNQMKREIELLRRERELLLKENEFYRRKEEAEKNQPSASVYAVQNNRRNVSDNNNGNVANEALNDSGRSVINNIVSLGLLKELLPEYDGTVCPEMWIVQFKNIAEKYSVDDSTLKALLLNKVKGKVQVWLHSKSDYINEELDDLFAEMLNVFSSKENKLVMRRNFEAYK